MVIASGVMDQRRPSPFGLPFGSSSSFFSEDQPIPERQVGFWKPESVVDQKGSNSVFSSPLEKTHPMNPASGLRNPEAETFKSQKDMLSLDNILLGQEKASNQTSSTWGDVRTSHRSRLGLSLKESAFVEPTSVERCVPDYENGLFSCSSATFSSKLRLASSSAPGQSFDINNSSCEEDEPLGSMEEIEAQTIGDLLPNDDDLISGVIDDFEYTGLSTIPDDVDEDIFCTGGGMELENDDAVECAKSQERSLNCPLSHEHPSAEHPGRTLLVGNIDNSMEDSELRALFQQYGDIHKLYTSCKHRGFVIISYYDTRAAQNAIRALHNKPSGSRNLDVHFYITKDNLSDKDINQGTLVVSNVDSSVSNDDLCRIFSVYGEVKGIHEAPTKRNHKFIEFYDVRAAEAALHGLNKNDILGQKIKLESGHLDGARYCLTQQCFIEQKNEQHGIFLQQPNNSPSACIGKLAPKSWENGSIHGLYSPTSPLVDKLLHGISSSVPQKLSSPIRIESIHQHSNQAGFGESGGSLDQRNFGRGMQVFHPHSLPEYQNTMCNNPKPMTPNGVHVSSRLAGVDCSRLHKVGSGSLHGHSFDQTEALGASGINSCPLHGHHYVWNSSNALPQNPSAPVLWSNLQHPIHVHGFPGVPRRMLNTSVQHHLGTSPAYGGSFAEMHPYSRSLGSIGFPGGAQMYPSELSVFPPARGNSREAMFSPVSVGFPSPQQRSRVTIGRNPMNSSTLYDAPNDRMRSRRHDGNANQSDKKHFDLDIDRIAKGEDSRTTLMIKNIPNKYTCKMLLAVIDENHRGTYDFIYLPIDFKNKCNVGYAFINMTDPQHIIPFFKTFNGKKWEKFNSEKVASLAYARIQGRGALIAHFQNSSLMNEDKRCRPMLFHKDGPNAGDQEPFPVGNNVRSRSGRNRPFTNPDTQQGSPSTSPNRETSSSGTNSPSSSTEEPLE